MTFKGEKPPPRAKGTHLNPFHSMATFSRYAFWARGSTDRKQPEHPGGDEPNFIFPRVLGGGALPPLSKGATPGSDPKTARRGTKTPPPGTRPLSIIKGKNPPGGHLTHPGAKTGFFGGRGGPTGGRGAQNFGAPPRGQRGDRPKPLAHIPPCPPQSSPKPP